MLALLAAGPARAGLIMGGDFVLIPGIA